MIFTTRGTATLANIYSKYSKPTISQVVSLLSNLCHKVRLPSQSLHFRTSFLHTTLSIYCIFQNLHIRHQVQMYALKIISASFWKQKVLFNWIVPSKKQSMAKALTCLWHTGWLFSLFLKIGTVFLLYQCNIVLTWRVEHCLLNRPLIPFCSKQFVQARTVPVTNVVRYVGSVQSTATCGIRGLCAM